MSFPPEIQNLLDALQALPGIKEIDIDLPTGLEDIKTDDLSLPGPFAELPHAALRRTKGGLEKEVLLQIFFELEATSPAHKSLELIAWIIRDWGPLRNKYSITSESPSCHIRWRSSNEHATILYRVVPHRPKL